MGTHLSSRKITEYFTRTWQAGRGKEKRGMFSVTIYSVSYRRLLLYHFGTSVTIPLYYSLSPSWQTLRANVRYGSLDLRFMPYGLGALISESFATNERNKFSFFAYSFFSQRGFFLLLTLNFHYYGYIVLRISQS